jgi:hypothetical protein
MQRWWPAGADFCSTAWQVPQGAGAAIACTTDAPWHDTQSAWPGFDATSVVSWT